MMVDRHCDNPACAAALVQTRHEGPTRFRTRRFCSLACANKVKREPTPNLPASKVCENARCGKVYLRAKTVPPVQWLRQRFCCQLCSCAANRIELEDRPSKTCEACGATYRKATKGTGSKEWERRRFCGKDCAARSVAQNQAGKPASHGTAQSHNRAVRRILLSVPLPIIPRHPAQTVDDFLASGGMITRCPTVILASTRGVVLSAADIAALDRHHDIVGAGYTRGVMAGKKGNAARLRMLERRPGGIG